ncbi:MAG: hypothetical protein LUE88_01440 [Clostridiales bacterium]|nr:hypothetical protein [Clostridiales bacterium]
MLYPTLNETAVYNRVTDRFLGINKNVITSDGEFSFTENVTMDSYPALSSRERRGMVTELNSPSGLAMKDSLVYADGADLYYNGERVEGIVLSTLSANCPKKFVSMGAYLCIFPDNLYLNTADMTDFGSMEMSWEIPAGQSVVYTLCKGDGTDYDTPTVSDDEPESPENGDLWIDTSGDVHVLKQYSKSMSMWTEMATTYVKIEAPGIGQNVLKGDGVRLAGCAYTGSDEALSEQIDSLNGTVIVRERGDNYIVITGIIDSVYTQNAESDGEVSVNRKVPKMDFVTECQNRLWGCYYGIEDGRTVNEIFCCKLGDFKNWEAYQGISTDSYRASCGSDGAWTGAVTYLGYPLFFKENYVHKVYVSSSGAHQIAVSAIDGVQKGSDRSFAIVNDYLLYKSPTGINIFDGTQAASVSDKLGGDMYYNAAGGALGGKYYVSMENSDGEWNLFVYDLKKGLWVCEDSSHIMHFAGNGGELYYIDEDSNRLITVRGSEGEQEEDFCWTVESGNIGYEYAEKKYLSRFKLRMSIGEEGYAEVWIQYDSNGIWEKRGVIKGRGLNRTFTLPVIPRRCDHLKIRLTGKGEFKLCSFSSVLERGSDI